MAATWGDVIARGYGAGRAIGDDIAQARFNKRERNVREEFERRAADEGKDLSTYLGEMEGRLRSEADAVGASRRGLNSAGDAYDKLSAIALRGTARRAGALSMGGNHADARDVLAAGNYGAGDYDAGNEQQFGAGIIRSTTGAQNPDGTYNIAKGAQGLANLSAQFGKSGDAVQQQRMADTANLKAAGAKMGQIAQMAQNIDKFSGDQFEGYWHGFTENVPMMAGTRLQKQGENTLVLVKGDAENPVVMGTWRMDDEDDSKEFLGMAHSFTQSPADALQSWYSTQVSNAAEERKRRDGIEAEFRKAYIELAPKLITDLNMPETVAGAFSSATKTLSDNGLKMEDITEPGTFIVTNGSNRYIVNTQVPVDPKNPAAASGAVTVTTLNGDAVDPSVLGVGNGAMVKDALLALNTQAIAEGYRLRTEQVKAAYGLLATLEAQSLGGSGQGGGRRSAIDTGGMSPAATGSGARGDRNHNTGNVRDVGQFKNDPDYIGTDDNGFAMFRTAGAGAEANHNQLRRYMRGQGVARTPKTNVSDIVNLWAPVNNENSQAQVDGYVKYVSDRLGVAPGATLSEDDIPRLTIAMGEFENGRPQRGVLHAAPNEPRRGAIATTADTSPAPATPQLSPAALAPRRPAPAPAASDLAGATAARDSAITALSQFRRDNPGELSRAQQRVMTQLRSNLRTATAKMREAETADKTAKAREARNAENKEASALYTRYGGASDFFDQF